MAQRQDLDDPNQKCIYLSADDPVDEDAGEDAEFPPANAFAYRDLPDGYELRLRAYQKAWSKCLERVQSIVRSLHTPVVHAVVNSVHAAHSKQYQLPGLPYPELPVIAVSASGGSNSVMSDVVALIETSNVIHDKGKGRMDEETDQASSSIVSHLYPADCTNILTAMKSIVTSFTDRRHDEELENPFIYPEATKRKATASIANYDLNLLRLWYGALIELNDSQPNLVVVLHNFEQYDSAVMENVFAICSQYLPDLPLVFLLAMSAPSPASFLRATLSRKTMSLLRVHVHSAPSGIQFVETIIGKTFFDLEFEPDIVLGSGALTFISEFCTRHTASLDALTTIIQLAYLRHAEEPLAVFIHNSHLGEHPANAVQKLEHVSSKTFFSALVTHIWNDAEHDGPNALPVPENLQDLDWDTLSPGDLLAAVDIARREYMHRAEQMRLGYQLLRLVQSFMRGYGYKPSISAVDGVEESTLELMCRIMQGKVSRDIQHLGRMIRKLPVVQLEALLTKLYTFFYELKRPNLRHEGTEHREVIINHRNDLSEELPHGPVAASFAGWLTAFLEEHLQRLDKRVLWEVWMTSSSRFPSELINPAPRASIVNALLHPHEVVDAHKQLFSSDAESQDDVDTTHPPPIWELPDTSILLHRYMEAPKLVNAYDWFESFAGVLDTQKERARKKSQPRSPTKQKGKGKEKQKAQEERESDGEEDEDEDEEWQQELHARFIRALHELDYMGFIKHTGRKADHVFKTVYDVLE